MSSKILHYILRFCFIGLTLSSVTVLGFTFFLLLPGTEGSLVERLISALQQLMLISHLIFPLVILIGAAYGIGLLHNHSEIIQILQQTQSYRLITITVAVLCAITVFLEIFIWPTLQQPEPVSHNQWQKNDASIYFNDTTVVKTDEGRILGASFKTQILGETIPTFEVNRIEQSRYTEKKSWLTIFKKADNKREAYDTWKKLYQALWPIPVFIFLWLKLISNSRSSSAANIAASVAITAIAIGLISEALHIVLAKALVAPILTMLIPMLASTTLTSFRILKSQ